VRRWSDFPPCNRLLRSSRNRIVQLKGLRDPGKHLSLSARPARHRFPGDSPDIREASKAIATPVAACA
jgi:hypothetical protein